MGVFDIMFDGLDFKESTHTYTFEGKRLRSTTGFVSQYCKPFDSYYWSEYKANKPGDELFGLEPEKIRELWNKKGKESMARGSDIHKAIEQQILEGTMTGFKYHNKQVQDTLMAWKTWWDDIKPNFEVEACELVMCEASWGLAGMADLIVRDKKDRLHIMDWKSGEKPLDEPAFRNAKMIHPFGALPDSNYGKYSGQLSFYKAMLEQKGAKIHNLICLHLTPGGVQAHTMIDVSAEATKLMAI